MTPLVTTKKRYENKYLVPESLSGALRDFVSFFCIPDPKAKSGAGIYTVNSLYFDTPDLRFFSDNRNRVNERIKPRVRFFGERPEGFVWLELKRRVKSTVWKTREQVPVDQWPEVLNPVPPSERKDRLPVELRIEHSVQNFLNVIDTFGALPVVHVRYDREAYVTETDPLVRITFDRRLSGCMAHGSTDLTPNPDDYYFFDEPAACRFFDSPMIFEIKCEGRFPRWVMELVERFGLIRQGFSKYCTTLDKGMSEFRMPESNRVPRLWSFT